MQVWLEYEDDRGVPTWVRSSDIEQIKRGEKKGTSEIVLRSGRRLFCPRGRTSLARQVQGEELS